ncbi:MAG: type II secretion system protein [Clostridiales bacterium]|nr:type II secretion system protein [Clostridiales bacterium]
MKKLCKDQKGFTMIELLIAVAIMGIVASAIGVFLWFGCRQYVYTNKQIKVQMEAQTVMNQVSNLIMECNNVELDPASTADIPSSYICINKKDYLNADRSLASKADMHITSSKKITLDTSENKLYIQDMITPGAKKELLGEYITNFEVTKTKMTDDKYFVTVSLDFDYSGMKYSLTKNLEIRNRYV